MDLSCIPDAIRMQHDAECVSFGLKWESEAYFTCRQVKAEQYQATEALKLMQKKEDIGQK
jgi:hypothetical protein